MFSAQAQTTVAVTPAITSVSFSLIFVPLDSSGNAKELVFIEINGAKGYGYDESLETSKSIQPQRS